MSAQPEVWRVSTVEGIFETDLETLRQWILEGCVLPTDKVCKGNLSWIDAGRVPKLKGAFNGEVTPPTPTETPVDPFSTQASQPNVPLNEPVAATWVKPVNGVAKAILTTVCHNHPDAAADYVCRMCGKTFCKECPRFVSGKVPVCPLCGDLCREYKAVTEKTTRIQLQSSGFGMEDFFRAIRYPLQHKAALFGGALIYSLLLLAGFRGGLVAWMIMFGCISHVISQVAWGRLNRSFMPDFSAFSFWDDLIVPCFLGVGIMVVSWGPVIALVLALMFGVLSGARSEPTSLAGGDHVESTGPSSDDLDVLMDPNADPEKLAAANNKLNQTRPGAEIAREAQRSQDEEGDPAGMFKMLIPYLGAGVLIVLLFLVLIAWGLFYYPMALTVAGYTQSFGSVINPLVGLDTIRRMGTTYFKAFAMVVVVLVVSSVVGIIVSLITAPFNLPFMGNLPAHFINGSFTFYFNLVIACVLGLSLFKCADRLGIDVD
ncbi:MAG TPA: FYVE zinc finger domain-containing protein [Pyrinomonadaceae bacterium]|nr:FYVE zinc finger domain-containing protein [Pyrinomonadaceae bacterium]